MTDSATKRPWAVVHDRFSSAVAEIVDADRTCVASAAPFSGALIVRAVNAHEDLVEVLRTLIFGGPEGDFQFAMTGNRNSHDKFMRRANALLSKLEQPE